MVSQSIVYRHQAEGIGEAAEAWKSFPDEAPQVCDLEDVLVLCAALVDALKNLQDRAFAALFTEKTFPVQRFGLAQRQVYTHAIPAFVHVEEGIAFAQKAGCKVNGAEAFAAHFDNLRALHQDFTRRWPLASEREIRLGQEEISRGASIKGEELFRGLAGGHR